MFRLNKNQRKPMNNHLPNGWIKVIKLWFSSYQNTFSFKNENCTYNNSLKTVKTPSNTPKRNCKDQNKLAPKTCQRKPRENLPRSSQDFAWLLLGLSLSSNTFPWFRSAGRWEKSEQKQERREREREHARYRREGERQHLLFPFFFK